ncbi:calcium/sodium antiporter [Candidatus Margulisiibacteriota bacterium]
MNYLLLQIFLFAIGVTLLIKGADWLIEGSVLTARVLKVSNLLIGLTVVAFGTSAPEMFVSLIAAIQQKPDISVGNIMGSCTANIALVLGCAALLRPINASKTITFVKMPMLLGSALLLTLVSWDLQLSRFDGLLLLLAFAGFMWFSIFHEKQTQSYNDEPKSAPLIKDIALIIIGLAGIIIGAQILINSATFLARTFGVSELVIGISIVAIGTSLPEMATSLVAVWKQEEDIGIANIVGSNIFNILLILGFVGLISPIVINPQVMKTDIWIMNGFTILLFVFCIHKGSLDKIKGLVFLAGYIAYIWYLFIR